MPDPRAIQRPSTLLALSEGPRAMAEAATLPFAAPLLAAAPRGDGHSVLVLPGFVASDVSTAVLRAYLRGLGYDVHGWELGRNLGPRAIGEAGERLEERLRAVRKAAGGRVSLIGWSLGGLMARLLAARTPDAVRRVVSLGSPFTGNPRASTVVGLYERLTGDRLNHGRTRAQMEEIGRAPTVPTTSIYTRADGIVAWQNCFCTNGQSENIEVRGSHCGLGFNAAALYAVADRLAQPEGVQRPFRPAGFAAYLYPKVEQAA